ncbi:DUF4238 domain-containing protein (plasmid) [Deinococcus sp. KNUC1210]|uniref:DUF4238 domain-containing protein n=1 Tax=Deinococcus sp. KNUC1210 TaxID=2917691 RepID=UPI001EF15795|nr:DUF4238 domain-containing protein [Deinococcus sp. KNUC1210]ULH18041.1 DUF4238 domain-containing protein [Deinococcus sp. KNUC1210]
MARQQNDAHWHHYVPIGYLKNFTNMQGTLCGYRKSTNMPFQFAKPRDVAAAEEFHTLPLRPNPVELEKRLDREFERPMIRTINTVLARVRLRQAGLQWGPLFTPEEHLSLAKFAALQLVRSNRMREETQGRALQYITPGVTLEAPEMGKLAHLQLLEKHMDDQFEWFGNTIGRHRLALISTTRSHPFWTSDDPVTVTRGAEGGKVTWGGVGLRDDHLELYLPLSWDVMAIFVGQHLTRRFPDLMHTRSDIVAERNRLTFATAHETVFSCNPFPPQIT